MTTTPEHPEWRAPGGATWVCGACGKHGKERDRIGDESCFLWAVLCVEDSVKLDHTGRATAAQAVKK